MTTVMIIGTIVTEIFTPQFVRWMFRGFSPAQVELTVHLTRILLPAQIFFYVGGVVSAVLLSHRLFLFPAFGPLLYNVFIILGGAIAGRRLGIASLAYGALLGSVVGPFLASVIGAARIGTGYRPSFDIMNPAFREWVRLSVPLMLGVSLVTADDWILRHYASSGIGDIARLNYAKRLFAVPIAVLGQATGQASLPFFARLFNEKRLKEFATTVNDSVYRVAAASFLATGWMMAAAFPLIDLVYRRGRFWFPTRRPQPFTSSGSRYRSLYGRPRDSMLALSMPRGHAHSHGRSDRDHQRIVAGLFLFVPQYGVVGLAFASDIGIGANLVALAVVAALPKDGFVGGPALGRVRKIRADRSDRRGHQPGSRTKVLLPLISAHSSRVADLLQLALISVTWAAATA